jgi:hypothetical protein
MAISRDQVVLFTEEHVLRHPLVRNFSSFAADHPPIQGWLPTGLCGAGGSVYALLQLSDKSAGRDFDSSDEGDVRELAALIGETLDAPALASATASSCGTSDLRWRPGGCDYSGPARRSPNTRIANDSEERSW